MLDHKVIGYIAALPRHQFFAHGSALLVTGEEATLKACIASRFSRSSAPERYEYRKVRYKNLDELLARGVSVVLDRVSYDRFAEAAQAAGRKFQAPHFDAGAKIAVDGIEVVKVSPNPRKRQNTVRPPSKRLPPQIGGSKDR